MRGVKREQKSFTEFSVFLRILDFEIINEFLMTDLDDCYVDQVNNEVQHVISGNPLLNNISNKKKTFNGIHYSESTQLISKFTTFLISFVTYPIRILLNLN